MNNAQVCVISLFTSFACLGSPAVGQLRFVNEVESTGTDDFGWGRGSAAVDLDNDGLLDIVNGNTGMDHGFFRQRPDGTFERMNEQWAIPTNLLPVWGTLAFDCDMDGDVDLFFVAGGANVPAPNMFMRNDLNETGTFSVVSAGDFTDAEPTQNFGGTVLDYDADGDLDIFLTTAIRDVDKPNILLRNDGNCQFTDVSQEAGITHVGDYRHAESADYNNDGYPDIGVSNGGGASQGRKTNLLYRNMGNGRFREVAVPAGVGAPKRNWGVMFGYFDADEMIDIVVCKWLTPPVREGETTRLYLNNDLETFRDVTEGSGITGQTDMGQLIAHFDGLNPYFFSGTGTPPWKDVDYLFRLDPNGEGGLTAVDVSDETGINVLGPTRCHGMALGDYDRDGDLDIYVNNGGPDWRYEYQEHNAFFDNQLDPENWLAAKLIGVVSNREAAGARMNLRTTGGIDVWRHQAVGNGFCSTKGPYHHFAGDDTVSLGAKQTLTIHWPQPSGLTQTVLSPDLNTFHDIIETGILDAAIDGDNLKITLCGPSGHAIDVFASRFEDRVESTEYNGIIGLHKPELVGSGVIPDHGDPGAKVSIITPLPPAILDGRVNQFYIQAWVRKDDGSTGTGMLTNVVTIDVK